MGPTRYSLVPWLSDAMDLRPQGEPETTVELCGGEAITHGLMVRQPFGPGSDAMLAIHAVRESGTITLSIAETIELDVRPIPKQSGTNRSPRQLPDDNGANEDRD